LHPRQRRLRVPRPKRDSVSARSGAARRVADLEDAHFFLAKALIRDGDVEAARDELRTVLALEGDRRDEASRLLAELP